MDGRPRIEVEGCTVYGRFSRWPMSAAGAVAGPEEVLLDTEPAQKACVQFSTHSTPSGLAKGADGYFYLSFGDGAGFASVDPGDLGHNPCGDADGLSGAFRAQDPNRWNGKTLRLDPVTLAPTLYTTGHRNPFRLTAHENDVYATETGW